MTSSRAGFSVIEIVIVLAIMTLLLGMGLNTFITYRKTQAFQKDTETVVEILNQARAQTMASKNATQYGVHFATSTVTLFAGSSYNASSSSNSSFPLTSTDIILNITLAGGGNDVLFQRLSGETSQNGSVVIDVPALSQTKTVTIYKTGVVDSN